MGIKKVVNIGMLVLGMSVSSCGTNYVTPVTQDYSLNEQRVIESIQNYKNDENYLDRFGNQIYELKEKVSNGASIENFGFDIETLKNENDENDIYFVVYYKF